MAFASAIMVSTTSFAGRMSWMRGALADIVDRRRVLIVVQIAAVAIAAADTLPGQPGHLLPIAVGVGARQEHVELAHFCLLPEKYRPPDHRKTVADSWDLGETVRPFIDHPVAQ